MSKLSKKINNLAYEVYAISDDKGFWTIDEISDFAIVPVKLALIADEVSEALRVHRDKYDGEVLKTITLQPGETIDINMDIGGITKFCIISNVLIGHDTIEKLIIGEPLFSNKPDATTTVR